MIDPATTSTTESVGIRGVPGAKWSEEEILIVKAKIRKTFMSFSEPLSQQALSSTGLPDETGDKERFRILNTINRI